MSAQSNTASKLSRTRGLKPFVKGDPRINRKGRPRSFDVVRELAQKIAEENIQPGVTNLEFMLRRWMVSLEPSLQRAFMEYAYGKVPDKLETTGADGDPLKPMVIQVITPAASGRK